MQTQTKCLCVLLGDPKPEHMSFRPLIDDVNKKYIFDEIANNPHRKEENFAVLYKSRKGETKLLSFKLTLKQICSMFPFTEITLTSISVIHKVLEAKCMFLLA